VTNTSEIKIMFFLHKTGESGYKAIREGIIPTDITTHLRQSPEEVLGVLVNMKNTGMIDADEPILYMKRVVG
jgi:hypothetical protein